jgi:hypothetical protein
MTIPTFEELEKKSKVIEPPTKDVVDKEAEKVPSFETLKTEGEVKAVHNEEPSFIDRLTLTASKIGSDVSKRIDNIELVAEQYAKESNTPIENAREIVSRLSPSDVAKVAIGQTAGAWFDVLGGTIMFAGKEALSPVAEGISVLIPDSIEDSVKTKFKEGLEYVLKNDHVESGLDAARGGVESYTKWKKENPVDAVQLESVVNIATFFTPPAVRAKSPPQYPVSRLDSGDIDKLAEAYVETPVKKSTIFKEMAEDFEGAAKAQVNKRRRKKAYSIVMPAKAKEADVMGKNTVDEVGGVKGLFNPSTLKPQKHQEEAIEYVSTLKINPSKGSVYNKRIIDEALELESNVLRGKLSIHSDVAIPQSTTLGRLDNIINKELSTNPDLVGEVAQKANRVYNQLKLIINNHGTRPVDILSARQSFDDYLKTSVNFFNANNAAGYDNLVRSLRNELNEIVAEAVPTDFVKKSLKKQSSAFTALQGIAPKVVDDVNSKGGALINNIGSVLGGTVRNSRNLTIAVGAAAGAGYYGLVPYITGVVGVGALGYALGRGVISPKTKKGVAMLLNLTDKAIATSKNPEMIKQLRADRALLVEALSLPVQQEENKEPQIEQ